MYSEDGEPLCSCDYLFPHVSLTESVNAKSRYYARLGRIPVPIPGPDTRWQLRYFLKECVKRPIGVRNVSSWKIQ